jgi:hypothetical protein
MRTDADDHRPDHASMVLLDMLELAGDARVLVVGDGNLTFARALARALQRRQTQSAHATDEHNHCTCAGEGRGEVQQAQLVCSVYESEEAFVGDAVRV